MPPVCGQQCRRGCGCLRKGQAQRAGVRTRSPQMACKQGREEVEYFLTADNPLGSAGTLRTVRAKHRGRCSGLGRLPAGSPAHRHVSHHGDGGLPAAGRVCAHPCGQASQRHACAQEGQQQAGSTTLARCQKRPAVHRVAGGARPTPLAAGKVQRTKCNSGAATQHAVTSRQRASLPGGHCALPPDGKVGGMPSMGLITAPGLLPNRSASTSRPWY